ncbi:MAG TPA: glycosyltransferase family 1 protein [Opitutaceae bacterium]|jgi:glycosyltransferase involved in cell wall biosynthesis|nr:glycosyltransferase family 1 protein [Opitutaceae bacterium]
MLLLDLTHTSHTQARTGIQRVARQLHTALCAQGGEIAVCFDRWQKSWRTLEPWEENNLSAKGAAASRGANWPWRARLRGTLRRHLGRTPPLASRLPPPASTSLLVPEIFSPGVADALPALFAQASGPRAAIFHDAIALKLPELTPAKTVARFPAYLRELLAFDGIAAISEDSRQSLLDYWRWLGVNNPPPVQTIPLGLSLPAPSAGSISNPKSQISNSILSVGSVEGRKNHLALLDACEQLWARGLHFELHLIGLTHPQTGRAALDKIVALQAAGRPLRYSGPVDDATVAAAYDACQFTVYPSLMEGFGLPVLESLAHGKPCVCSGHGALGEAARGGGCVALDAVDAGSLATAILRLLQNPSDLAALAAAARARTFKSWHDYAAELSAWLPTLSKRTKRQVSGIK